MLWWPSYSINVNITEFWLTQVTYLLGPHGLFLGQLFSYCLQCLTDLQPQSSWWMFPGCPPGSPALRTEHQSPTDRFSSGFPWQVLKLLYSFALTFSIMFCFDLFVTSQPHHHALRKAVWARTQNKWHTERTQERKNAHCGTRSTRYTCPTLTGWESVK